MRPLALDLFCRPATSDLPVGVPHGLELKRLGETTTEFQDEVAAWFRANGWPWAMADRIEDAWRILYDWGALRMRVVP